MERLTLTRSQRREYEAVLKTPSPHERVRVTLLTHQHKGTGIKLDLIEWSVTDSRKDSPKQTAHVTVAGNIRRRHIYSRLLQITHYLWLPTSEMWAPCHQFTGPVQEVERNPFDGTIEINASSKDSQHIAPSLFVAPFNLRKGIQIHKAIRKGLEERGEAGRYRFPEKTKKLHKARSWPAFNDNVEPWRVFRNLAEQIDRKLYYDGRGNPTLERVRKAPAWKFADGRYSTALGFSERQSMIDLYNMVVVKGGQTRKKGDKKKRVTGRWKLRNGHRFSAKSLTGGKRPRVLVVERDKIHQRSEARQRARKIGRRKAGRDEREVSLSSAIVPFLQAGDRVKVNGHKFIIDSLTKGGATMELNL